MQSLMLDHHENTRSMLSSRAIARVKRFCPEGILTGTKRLKPAINARLEAAKAALETTWQQCREGKGTMEDFKRALADWEQAHRECVKLMKGSEKTCQR